jgi:methionyl-tRNA formyltransferase
MLPKYPGASPVQQALLEGESTTGVTVFQLDEGVDSGPILNQVSSEISPEATAGSLLEELTVVGSDLLLATLEDIDSYIQKKSASRTESFSASDSENNPRFGKD